MNADPSAQLTAAATIAAAVVALVALIVSTNAYRGQRLAFVASIRAEWEQLYDRWATTILLHDLTWDYYSDASVAEKSRVRKLVADVSSKTLGLSDEIDLMRQETRGVRQVARFFAYVSEAILRGQMTVLDAYAILGPDVARHRDTILWISGKAKVRPVEAVGSATAGVDEWIMVVDQITEWTFFDNQELIVALADLMWSEMAKRGDTYPHLILGRASALSTDKRGPQLRRSVSRLVRGHWRCSRRVRLAHQLQFAERIRWKAVNRDVGDNRIFFQGDENHIRRFVGTAWIFKRSFRRRFPNLGVRAAE